MPKTISTMLKRVSRLESLTELDEVTRDLCLLIRDAASCRWTMIFLLDRERHLLNFSNSCGLPKTKEILFKKRTLSAADIPLIKRIARNAVATAINGKDTTLLFPQQAADILVPVTLTAFPLLVKRQVTGILVAARDRDLPPLGHEEAALLQHLVSHAALTVSHLNIHNQLLEVALETARQYEEMRDIFISTIVSLTNAIDAKSSWTKGHSERVMYLSLRIAREMGLDLEETEHLRISSLLHDVGKIGIIEKLLEKPERLSDDEFPPMRLHPEKGVAILYPIKKLREVLPDILHHHEKYDGSGYPNGLSGEAIPLHARIIAVADAFDAMVSARPYRPGLPHSQAMQELVRCAGTQFDPKVVEYFQRYMERHIKKHRKESP